MLASDDESLGKKGSPAMASYSADANAIAGRQILPGDEHGRAMNGDNVIVGFWGAWCG